MNTTSRSTDASSSRLRNGAALLAAAEVVDTKLVTTRLSAFAEAHRNYAEAERKVEETEARLEAERLKLAQLGADHDEAVEKLACRLADDGQPRGNPFEAFGAESPSIIKRKPPAAAAARAVRVLLAGIQRQKGLSQATVDSAEHVEQVTQKVEAALVPLKALREEVRAAHRMCDVVARKRDSALSALRRGAKAAEDEGAPGLYAALFPPVVRAVKKSKEEVKPEQPAAENQPQSAVKAA